MAPIDVAQRTSRRLQQKRNEAHKREPMAGCPFPLHKSNNTPMVPGSTVGTPLFTLEQVRFRDSAPNKPDESELSRGKKRKRTTRRIEPPGDYNQEDHTRPPYYEENPPCKKPPQKRQKRQRRRQQQQQQQQQEEDKEEKKEEEREEEEKEEEGQEAQIKDPIGHWALHGSWPPGFANMTDNQSDKSVKRRRSSGELSYSARYKNGEVPPAHSAASEANMLLEGIDLDLNAGSKHISNVDRKVCDTMLAKSHEHTPSPPFPMSKLPDVIQRLSTRNEDRLARDLTPLVVPSPENLNFSGIIKAPTILEDVGALWKRLKTMGGPIPKPDLTVGIGESAFSREELAKLRNYWSWDHATLFTDWLYFPFLICEVKCSDTPVTKGARQVGHASGVAANAIFQLCHSVEDDRAKTLNRRILTFSIVHDHRSAEIYGVYPLIKAPGERPVFHRYVIKEVLFGRDPQKVIKEISDFVIEIYASWYPKHLKRVKDALKDTSMPEGQPDDIWTMGPPTISASQLRQEQDEELIAQFRHQIREQKDEFERKQKEREDELQRKNKELKDELEREIEQLRALIRSK